MSASLSTFAIPPSIFRPQKLEVTVRYAIPSDIPSIADVVAQSMLDDELFKYVCPGRRQYYGSFRNAFLRRVKEGFVIPGWCLIVAVARTAVGGERGEERGGKEVVLGYCAWERRGDDKHAEEWKREKKGFFWKGLERTLLNLEEKYINLFKLDKSCIPGRYAPFSDAINAWTPFFKIDSNQPLTETYWHVNIIAVDPKYQRCGIGTRLLQWGLEQAERERVPVALEASEKGFGLYKKMGFKTVIETSVVGDVKMIGMTWEPGDLSNKKKVA